MTRILILDAGGCRILDHGASIGHNIADTIATRAPNIGTFVTVNPSNTFAVEVARWSAAVLLCCGAVVSPASISCCRWLYPDTATTQSNTLQLQLPETVRYLLSSSPKLMEILRLDTDMYLFGGNLWKYKIWVEPNLWNMF